MQGFFPPSSRVTLLRLLLAAASLISWPTCAQDNTCNNTLKVQCDRFRGLYLQHITWNIIFMIFFFFLHYCNLRMNFLYLEGEQLLFQSPPYSTVLYWTVLFLQQPWTDMTNTLNWLSYMLRKGVWSSRILYQNLFESYYLSFICHVTALLLW